MPVKDINSLSDEIANGVCSKLTGRIFRVFGSADEGWKAGISLRLQMRANKRLRANVAFRGWLNNRPSSVEFEYEQARRQSIDVETEMLCHEFGQNVISA
jgi:hypothetical protein